MIEKDFDSSMNEYEEEVNKNYNIIKTNWDMAIGLQLVDDLKPSKYLEKLINDNINGTKTLDSVKSELNNYYEEKTTNRLFDKEEYECDVVSVRIVELLNENSFELSVNYFKYIHKYLFQDVYDFAGKFREVDITKKEIILNNDTVSYCAKNMMNSSLEYDIELENNKVYKDLSVVDLLNGITNFSSSIWEVHPFREGNTRTVAVFVQKYLISLGYSVNNTLFKENSTFYRNALVRSCYVNRELNISSDSSFLLKFYENLLLGKNNEMNSKDLVI